MISILPLLESKGFICNLSYETFSSSPTHRRFRLISFLDQAITDFSIFKKIMGAVIKLTHIGDFVEDFPDLRDLVHQQAEGEG